MPICKTSYCHLTSLSIGYMSYFVACVFLQSWQGEATVFNRNRRTGDAARLCQQSQGNV